MQTQWTVGKNLIASFSALAMITLILGFIGYYGALRSESRINEIGKVRLRSVDSLLILKEKAESIVGILRTLGLTGLCMEMRRAQYDKLAEVHRESEAAWGSYESLHQTGEETELWNRFLPAWESWKRENTKFIEMARQLERIGIQDPAILIARLYEVRGIYWKTLSVLADRVKEGKSLSETNRMNTFMAGSDSDWVDHIQTDNPEIRRVVSEIIPLHRAFLEAADRIEKAEQGDLYSVLPEFHRNLFPSAMTILDLVQSIIGEAEKAVELSAKAREHLLGPVMQAQSAAIGLLDQLVRINRGAAAAEVEQGRVQARFMKIFILIAMILGVILALGLGVFMARSISRTLKKIGRGLVEASNQVAAASRQVSGSSQYLAEGASNQAASIEETSASMEEMSSMTRQNAQNAKAAKARMAEAREIIEKVNHHMGDMGKAIQEIAVFSEDTGKIIKTIDEIAFQTKLLALNAAVEAARAGEAGAGFAVVADEVRNLAIRAAEAAKNTADLIESTIRAVRAGYELTQATQESFKENMAITSKVGVLVEEIAVASSEQAHGIEQVNKAVADMDKVVQQNAANAEESASGAEEMNAQAEQMKTMVNDLVALVGAYSGEQGERASEDMVFQEAQREAGVRPGMAQFCGRAEGKKRTAHPIRPEEVIPLEDDDFKDF